MTGRMWRRAVAAVLGALLAVLAWLPAEGAASFVQQASKRQGAASTIVLAFTGSVTAGNAIAVFVQWANTATLNSVTDSLGNSYTIVNNPTVGGAGFRAALAYATDITGGTCTVTATFSGSAGSDMAMMLHEATGANLAFDGSNIQHEMDQGTGTNAWNSPAIVTTTDGDYLAGFAIDEGYGSTWTAGTGWTDRHNESEMMSESQVQTSAGSISSTFTDNDGFIDALMGVLAFKEVADVGGGGCTGARLTLMGAGC